jgi:hypothetical protein
MSLPNLADVGNLPFHAMTAAALWQLLGPSAAYLGVKGKELTEKSVENIERVFKHGLRMLPKDAPEGGAVPPRVLRSTINEGAFTEDQIAAAYLGGVLASSRSGRMRDDRGVCINAMISRLSVFQLRLHYVLYSAMHYMLQGTGLRVGSGEEFRHTLHFGTTGLYVAMGFFDDSKDPSYDIDVPLSHALFGLDKENLITGWSFSLSEGLKCEPTAIGVEFFLWANGQGDRPLEHFYSREFEPLPLADDETEDDILIFPGSEYLYALDSGESVILNGFDYGYGTRHEIVCKVSSQT